MRIAVGKIMGGLLCLLPFTHVAGTESDFMLNQVGFYPQSSKYAIISKTKDTTFNLVNESGQVVFTGALGKNRVSLGDTVRIANFSAFTEKGTFKLKVTDKGTSYPFVISDTVFKSLANAAMKSFYFQRASMPLEAKYAGVYARPAGHPDTACEFHSTTGKPATPALRSPGGWYDAGDFGKYTVNAGVSVGTLLQLYELYPDYYPDNSLNIPESGNGVSDLLDEVKYELDWLKTMQDTDGKVFHKLATQNFPSLSIMPEDDKSKRYIIGLSAAGTFDFAAMMAMAGRIYKNIDKTYADDCLARAEKAWDWATANSNVNFTANPSGWSSGPYQDSDSHDEKVWATAELLITTGKEKYKIVLDSTENRVSYSLPDWQKVGGLAALSLVKNNSILDSTYKAAIRTNIISAANTSVMQITGTAFRIPSIKYTWGSNSFFGNAGIALAYAYALTNDPKYILAAEEVTDYLLGRNVCRYSFVTGYGSKTPMNIHHRQCVADAITAPIPGFVVGGPNNDASDYQDIANSAAYSEIAINWNAPLVFLVVAVDKNLPAVTSVKLNNVANKRNAGSSLQISQSGLIDFTIVQAGATSLKVFDVNGKLVKDYTPVVKKLPVGKVTFDLRLANARGVYIIRFFDGNRWSSLAASRVQ